MIRLTLPECPSANRYWRHVVIGGSARVLLSSEARFYRRAVERECQRVGITPLAGPLAVWIVWLRGARRGDLDNRIKQVLDALQGHAFGDDAQIAELHATLGWSKERPRMEVEIWQLGDAPLLAGG